ncbi:MAG: DUF2127 domain-containing protein [Thermotaleaceae bacterium]
MKKLLKRDNIINIGFYGGLVIKAINALIEFIGGFLMIIVSHDWINRLIQLIALPELQEDPKDIVMNYIITLGENLSISSQHSIAIYMLLHGSTKLAVIWLLWKKKMWAYPFAVVVFGLFIAYGIYSYLHNHSLLMLLIIIIDVAIVVMIILEFKRLEMGKMK